MPRETPRVRDDPELRPFLRVRKYHKRLRELRDSIRWLLNTTRPDVIAYRQEGVAVVAETLAEQLTRTLRPIGRKDFAAGEGDDE
jgi:hypothetical protein